MNANAKILNVLIEEMGAAAILAICQERLKIKSSPAAATPPSAPKPAETPKAPVKVVNKKVVIKKADEPVVKNLGAELASVTPSTEVAWVCPPCNKGPGNDHRLCVTNNFNCDVEAWETAIGLRKTTEQKTATPVVVKKTGGPIIVKKVAASPAPSPSPAPAPAPVPAPASEPSATESKKAGRPKKVAADVPRCDGRTYGEEVEMEGTKAPNGKPLHCYRPAQCERKGHEILAVPEEGDPRHLKEGEEVAEDEGKFHLCKICIKRWEGRAEHADNWHGFFDDDGAPETSHFINGAWHQKKMAAVKNEEQGE